MKAVNVVLMILCVSCIFAKFPVFAFERPRIVADYVPDFNESLNDFMERSVKIARQCRHNAISDCEKFYWDGYIDAFTIVHYKLMD